MNKKPCGQKVHGHPCFGGVAYHTSGRIHLPVAPRCDIKCRYCVRKHDCANENKPGITSRIIKPDEAVRRVRDILSIDSRIRVVGIAGPGDPLSNPETFETLDLVHQEFPHLVKCLSTNGLLLLDFLHLLKGRGVSHLTITINAVDTGIGKQIYSWVWYKGKIYSGETGFPILSSLQLNGLKAAVDEGILVKVNSVLVPGVNDGHLVEVAQAVAGCGAHIMNIMKLIPQGEFADKKAPSWEEMEEVRKKCEAWIPIFRGCRQCRADAVGML